MEIQIKIIGTLLITLALMHCFFPRRFGWREELSSLTVLTRQIMYVQTLFIALTVLMMGVLCVVSANALINTPLGKQVLLGFGIFWVVRLLIQFFGYSSELWRGKTFETGVHIVFSIMWIYFSAVFFSAWWL